MRLAFVTCVELGLSCINAIYNSGEQIETIITLKDEKGVNKSGRVYLDDFCIKKKIELIKLNNINDESSVKFFCKKDFDWIFIIGWSQIANNKILNSAKFGVIGAHPTLLPEGRGRASIPWAILKGLKKTGVSFFKMDKGVDTGKIIYKETIKIVKNENARTLYEKVKSAHGLGILKILPNLKSCNLSFVSQDESKATYWVGRKPEDGLIDLYGSVFDAEKLIRATTKPYPGAYFIKDDKKTIVWKASLLNKNEFYKGNKIVFKDGILKLEEITEMII